MNWKFLLIALALFVCTVQLANGSTCLPEFVGKTTASYVFPANNSNTCAYGVGKNILDGPGGIHIYYSSLLFVADDLNNRVLTVDIASNTAIAVFGQLDYNSYANSTSQNGLAQPFDVYVETSTINQGRLWVADFANNRITWYDNAVDARGANISASGVIGQTSFESSSGAVSRNGLNFPASMILDERRDILYVTDTFNNRVLWFRNPTERQFGKRAAGVIGTSSTQDFTTTGSFFSTPYASLVDNRRRLYVADFGNNRVVRYDDSKSNSPTVVFGQASFQTYANATSATGLDGPISLAFDPTNNILFVSDYYNNRVVGYPSVSTVTENAPEANIFIAQNSSTSKVRGCSPALLYRPWGINFDVPSSRLWVSEYQNSVVLAYCSGNGTSSSPVPSPSVVPATTGTRTGVRTTSGGSTGGGSTSGGSTSGGSTGSRTTSGRRF